MDKETVGEDVIDSTAGQPCIRTDNLALEIVLVLMSIVRLLPCVWFNTGLNGVLRLVLGCLGISQASEYAISYLIGYVLLTLLVARFMYVCITDCPFTPTVKRLAGSMAAFATVYLFDFLISSAFHFDFQLRTWSLYALSAFFLIVLYLTSR